MESGVSLLAINLPTLWFLRTLIASIMRKSKTATVEVRDHLSAFKTGPRKSPPRLELLTVSLNDTELDHVEA